MEQDILRRLEAQEELLRKVYESAEKTRKYFQWTLIAAIVFFVVPLVGLLFLLPAVMGSMLGI